MVADKLAILRNRPLMMLALGHFTVDMYVGLLPVLYPLLIERFSLNLKSVGLVALAYTGAASLSQPFFGWIADRYGTRYIGWSLIWSALTFSMVGFAPSFAILLLLTGAAGLGSGAYHPLGAVNASAVIPEKFRNTATSIYVTGGTLGVAFGPIAGALITSHYGMRGTMFMFPLGMVLALWLLAELRSVSVKRSGSAHGRIEAKQPHALIPLVVVIGVMMCRTWTTSSLTAFIPTWYKSLGYSPAFYSLLATTLLLSSAIGTVGAGALANRFGRRAVIIGTVVLTIPSVLLFAQFPGPLAFVTITLVGLFAASTAPLLLIMAQRFMASKAGMASGLILGIGFVTGAIGVPITGAFADAHGIQNAMRAQVFLVVATIPLAWLLPRDKRHAEDVDAGEEHLPPAPL